jgi:cytochrome c553
VLVGEKNVMQRNKLLSSWIYAAIAITASQVAQAEPSRGQALAAQCAQCHGTDGTGGFESLAGRGGASLYNGLLEMKYRPVEGIMDHQARGYTDEQLWLIAEYFATQQSSGGSDD